MLKRILLTALLVARWLILPAQVNFNGNLEIIDKDSGRPGGWTFYLGKEHTYNVGLDSVIKRQGKYSVSITAQEGKDIYGTIKHIINHSFHGKHLMLVGSVKTEDVNDGFAGLWLCVNGLENKVLAYENMEDDGIKGTNDWKEYYIELPYNEYEAVSINAGALLVGKGKVWIDSLRLYLDEKPIDEAHVKQTPFFPGELDTAFSRGSGIDTIILTRKNTEYLNLVGQLWGFLKYHHPAVAKGDYNWDAELIRLLPHLLKCKNNNEASALFEAWLDKLGQPAACTDCKPITNEQNIAIAPDYGNIFNNPVFSSGLLQKLQYILANRNTTYNYYVTINEQVGNPEFRHEKLYADMLYPDAGYRLLALYRYWNIIQYFFPSRHLITERWNSMLHQYLPGFIYARNATEYAKAMTKMIASIHDGHAALGDFKALSKFQGDYRVPFQAKFIENKLVITDYYSDSKEVKSKFRIGDIILSINGEKVQDLVRKYIPYVPASNYDTKLRDMPGSYLLRSDKKHFIFRLSRDGKPFNLSISGVKNSQLDFWRKDWNPKPEAPARFVLSDSIGYLFAAKFKSGHLKDIRKEFKNTKGLVVDLRCYPTDEMIHTLGNYIKPFTSAFAKFTRGFADHPGLFVYTDSIENGEKSSDNYKERVVVLVNAYTQSNAEYVTMAFQSSPNVTVIGSTTAGADGNISNINLPGGITTNISGLGVFYPDGTNAQRKGVKIDYFLKPTIKGIKEGKDELLEKAQDIILKGKASAIGRL
ncbi:C-terminal processing protease CtpA/Prc [Arcticibacter tournemirensis]|uniref:Peptidase S41 n=1 Tax=Arcticibacter tournemirensis TaxID=699437 RepID=A0A5M9GQZ8_9SPHI|nr:S41 family peptidase [Arcticibacter tournemirensis]KAA8477172.1 peptidase S41 [Arcticibacter tournemirensis]TQM51180.1 C-terminal processing protease CtpA/Prc [Arcticibacter tournemirensis]